MASVSHSFAVLFKFSTSSSIDLVFLTRIYQYTRRVPVLFHIFRMKQLIPDAHRKEFTCRRVITYTAFFCPHPKSRQEFKLEQKSATVSEIETR